MMYWLVTWIVVTSNLIGCPQPEPYVDDYGINQGGYNVTTQACFDTDIKRMSKEFTSRQEAEEFVKIGNEKSTWRNELKNFKVYERDTILAPQIIENNAK